MRSRAASPITTAQRCTPTPTLAGFCQAALFSLTTSGAWAVPPRRYSMAARPASPRRQVGAMTGRDRAGVTALLQSVTQLDLPRRPTAQCRRHLHPSAGAEEGLAALWRSSSGSSPRGLRHPVQRLDVATLREAQRHPERHAPADPRHRLSVYLQRSQPTSRAVHRALRPHRLTPTNCTQSYGGATQFDGASRRTLALWATSNRPPCDSPGRRMAALLGVLNCACAALGTLVLVLSTSRSTPLGCQGPV